MSKSKPSPQDPFMSIDADSLSTVSGGATRITARSSAADDQLTTMLTGITDSIKQLAAGNQGGMDPMMMMMMMMMGGGGGGGAAAAPAQTAAPAPQQPVINISTTVKRHGW